MGDEKFCKLILWTVSPFVEKLLESFTVVLFVLIQFSPLCHFGKFIPCDHFQQFFNGTKSSRKSNQGISLETNKQEINYINVKCLAIKTNGEINIHEGFLIKGAGRQKTFCVGMA